MVMLPQKGTTVFYADEMSQWPFVVCELHDEKDGTISGWAFEPGKTSYYRKVPFSSQPQKGHWQFNLRDERFGQAYDKP